MSLLTPCSGELYKTRAGACTRDVRQAAPRSSPSRCIASTFTRESLYDLIEVPFPSRQAAVVGVYTTEHARAMERAGISLELEAIRGALDDAGLTVADVDGIVPSVPLFTTSGLGKWAWDWPEQFWAAQLGGRPLSYTDRQSGALGAQKAAAAVAAGLANVVVLFHGKSHYQLGPGAAQASDGPPRVDAWSTSTWGGFMTPWYAMWARRYMHEFGVTSEDLAQVGVVQRYHATLNPDSLMGSRGEITVDDVISSRMIADPLHLLDCSLDNDGGWAIVIASADVARGCKKRPVWVIGAAEGTDSDLYLTVDAPWIGREDSAVRRVGDITFGQAGISREDIDVANLYDCFSITFIRDLEELGFCHVGEGADYVKSGITRLGGAMPCNTDGGLMSGSHVGNPTGMMTIEVVRQLRAECGARQVPDAKIGLAFSQGNHVHGVAGSLLLAVD